MADKNKIDLDVFKVITSAVTRPEELEPKASHLSQLVVSALEIKGSAIFALNPETEELELLASSGLSLNFINKGPVLADKSPGWTSEKEPVVISDIKKSDRLQYPEETRNEGIAAIVSVPISFQGKVIGALRLYHHQVWDVSEQDIDSLKVIAANIGMVMMYSRILNALRSVKTTINEIHTIWLEPKV